MPNMISKAHVWHNGYRNRFFPMVSSYTTYIALELEEGYVEYGFCPGSFFSSKTRTRSITPRWSAASWPS